MTNSNLLWIVEQKNICFKFGNDGRGLSIFSKQIAVEELSIFRGIN